MISAEQQERDFYVRCISAWVQDPAVLALLTEMQTVELANMYVELDRQRMLHNVQWGASNAASASPAQLEDVIDAVGLDTRGRFFGTELTPTPIAGGCTDQAPLLWSRARRRQLERMFPPELASECQKVLAADSARLEAHGIAVAMAASYASKHGQELVSLRYPYKEALIEAAAHLRRQRFRAKNADLQLFADPFVAGDGSIVTGENGTIVVRRGEKVIGRVSIGQFQRKYWPQAKISGYDVSGNRQA